MGVTIGQTPMYDVHYSCYASDRQFRAEENFPQYCSHRSVPDSKGTTNWIPFTTNWIA